MTKLSSALLGAALIVGGCCPPKKADTTTTVVTPPTPDAGPTQEPPAPTPSEAAQAEVARLRAIADAHPLLAAWTGPYGGVPPWDRLDVGQLGSAYAAALPLYEAEAAVIATNPEAPTFANTFVPLEDAGRHLDRLDALFGVMTSNLSTPEVQAVDKEWSPKVAATYDRLTFNAALFQRIAAVYAARASLTPEQARLVTRRYQEAVRSGAQLGAADQAKLGAINEQLAGKFAEFSARVLADEDTWIVLDDKAQLAGLSASQIAAYAAAAEERELPGKWVVVNTRSSVDPFLTASARRDLRQRVWEAFKARGDHGDGHDTKALIGDIVRLRAERAKLLGFATHAHWRMADTMAVDPAKANDLMMRVWPAAVARVKQEVKDMTAIARKEPGNRGFVLEPWDYLYYAEKVRDEEVRPRPGAAHAVLRARPHDRRVVLHGRAAVRPALHRDHRHRAGVPPRRAGVEGRGHRRPLRRAVLRRLLRARRQALGRVGHGLPPPRDLHRHDTDPARVEQQQLRPRRGRRAGADLARRRRDPVPRVRPRAAQPAVGGELPGARHHAARLRRVPVAGPRAVGAVAADPRQVRAALPDRQADAAGAGRQDRAGRDLQPGLRHGRVPDLGDPRHAPAHAGRPERGRRRGVRARHAGGDRRAARGGDAAPPAAVQPPVHQRRVLRRLLQLPVERGDGRRHPRRVPRGRRRVRSDGGRQAAAVHPGAGQHHRPRPRPTARSAAAIPTSARCSASAASRPSSTLGRCRSPCSRAASGRPTARW
jgi:hypothetical protein